MHFLSLSHYIPYEKARELQLKLVELRVADKIPDTVLFLEHEPVITRGRGLQWSGKKRPSHLPLRFPLPPEIAYVETERGGDLTYHGPGQLVVYPICKLDGKGFAPRQDVGGFLRKLENSVIEALKRWEITAHTLENATGVWVGDHKLASIGIAVKKWVTYHGIAMNCVNDLMPFQWISPCGFHPEVMTRLQDLTLLWNKAEWRKELEQTLAEKMRPDFHSIFHLPFTSAFSYTQAE